VLGEEPLLTNLLVNLVSNSFKFRRPGVAPKVHVSARRIGDEWEISCADNGIGIEPEFVDKIFVIFQRLHSKDAYPGTGIGLAIAKKIVEYHGGRVWVETEVAEGTLIRFTVPVVVEEEPAAVAPAQETPESPDADQTPDADQPQDADQPPDAGKTRDSKETQDAENVKEVAA
jgi:light-regulated signal transduction histidine kinase (bacteriophytochrome)